jgi:hypothetical protein
MLIRERVQLGRFGSILVPLLPKIVLPKGNILEHDALAILSNHQTGQRIVIPGRNIVTDEGDKFYAQSACGETPTKSFTSLYLCTAGPATPAKDDDTDEYTEHAGSEKAASAGYPKTNDDDGDNTGAGVDVISWKFEYTTGDGPFVAITHSYISIASAGAAEAILNSYKWAASWGKDSSTSCKVFANHTANGV